MSELDTTYYRGRFEYVEFGPEGPEGDFARCSFIYKNDIKDI